MKAIAGRALFGAVLLLLAGCQEPLRVPYIPAELHGWPRPYRGVSGIEVHVLDTGTLRVREGLLFRGGSMMKVRSLESLVFLIHHPRHGWIAVDTGLDPALNDDAVASRQLGTVLALLLDVGVVDGGIRGAMQRAGLHPERVKTVILSDLHLDHAGGLDVFPQARVVVSRREVEQAAQGGFGYAPPDPEETGHWKQIDFRSDTPLGTFPRHLDLFGDGSVELIDVAGHSAGSIAVLVRAAPRPILIAGDLVAVASGLRDPAAPAAAWNVERQWESLWRLKKLMQLVPDLIVLPGHDLEAAAEVQSGEVVVHEEEEPAPEPSPTAERQRWRPAPLQ